MSEPRKATDVLVDLETKVDTLLGTIQTMDFNIKILSNKLGEIMKNLEKQQAAPAKIVVEAIQAPVMQPGQAIFGKAGPADPERSILIKAEAKLPEVDNPDFRRTSRSESFSCDGAYLKRAGVPAPHETPLAPGNRLPKPPPGRNGNDALPTPVPQNKAVSPSVQSRQPQLSSTSASEIDTRGVIPVEQRVVGPNGKSVFLADVEITNTGSGEQVSKSRTNGTGKWFAALPLGEYKVVIRKLESLTREKVEAIQTIKINGSESPLKLPIVILK